jgi:cyclic pyranopterin phosphate synthase
MRKVTYLRVSVTDRCNFACLYCAPRGRRRHIPHSEILRYEEIVKIAEAFKELGVDTVRVTGGEPLVRKEVEKLIESLSSLGLKEVSLTTNGFLLQEKAKALKEAGLSRVNISIDSLNPEKFAQITGTGDTKALGKVIQGLEAAIEAGLTPVKVNTVLIRGFTDSELEDFVRFSEEYNVEVRFIELMPIGENTYAKEKFMPVSEVKEALESRFGKLTPVSVKKKGPASSFKVNGTGAVVGFIPSVSQHFCAYCNRMRLTSDGRLRMCLVVDEEVDLKKVIRPNFSKVRLVESVLEAFRRKSGITGIHALKGVGCQESMTAIGG